jgi:hypothetical protein
MLGAVFGESLLRYRSRAAPAGGPCTNVSLGIAVDELVDGIEEGQHNSFRLVSPIAASQLADQTSVLDSR